MAGCSSKVIALAIVTALAVLVNVIARWFPLLRLIVWAFFTGAATSLGLYLVLMLLTVNRGAGDDPYSSHEVLRSIKPLAFTSPESWLKEAEAVTLEDSFCRVPLHPPSFVLSDSLDVFLDCILHDFVNSWYLKISEDPSFTTQVDRTVHHVLEHLRNRLQSLDLVEIVVGKIVPLLTLHLHDFSAAERIVRGKHLNKNLTESEELDLAIASKYRDGKLHPAASLKFSDTKLAQQDHLRRVAEVILPSILPEREKKGKLVGILIKEIVACAIIFPALEMLGDPDFWNRFIEAIGRSTLQDRKTVRKLRAALDQHATPRQSNSSNLSKYDLQKSTSSQPFIRLTSKDDERTFERFIRSIRMCANLSDARRLRNEISAQLKRDGRVEGDEGWGIYIKRLETGKRVVDQKVISLSAGHVALGVWPLRSRSELLLKGQAVPSRLELASLDHVLRDSSGLSYFMEHMDRQKRLALVQFWLVVDGLRNPLEEDISSSDDEQESSSSTSLPAWTMSDRNDLEQIHDAYLSILELQISEKSKNAVKDFLQAGSKATQGQYSKARAAVLRAQTTVLEAMQKKDFSEFKGSDLFYKYLASDETAAAQGRLSPGASGTDMHRSSSWTGSSRTQDPPEDLLASRHSFDGNRVLESSLEDWDFDPLSTSKQSIEDEQLNIRDQLYPPPSHAALERRRQTPENGIVEAMEAALNDIIEERPSSLDESRGSLFQDSPDLISTNPNSPRSSIDVPRDNNNGNGNGQKLVVSTTVKEKGKTNAPSISSLGLVNSSTKDAVFADELFPDEDATADYVSSGGENEDKEGLYETNGSEEEIHQAAPGDLGLAEAISALTFDIEKLSTQEAVIDSLYRKAELTNNTVELRILRKSKSSLQREIRRKELQRQQYIVQESDNGLFGRSTIRIKSTMVGNENGQEYALYIIEVQRKGGEQIPAAQWAVARRYSEFFQLHQQLRARFDLVKQLDFPRRRVVMKLQKDFLEKRRTALDKYLKSVLLIPDVCRSRELRAFLSQQSIAPQSILTHPNPDDDRRDIISRLYNSIADGMEDVLGNIPMLDQLSLASANIITTAAASQMQTPQKNSFGGEMLNAAEAEAELSAFEDKEAEPFVKPICDLFLEVFELNRGSNWLRGRAVVVVLHQLLGGTIERKAREQAKSFLDEESILRYIRLLKDSMWPEGNLQQGTRTRTPKEKSKTRTEASLMLATLLPDIAASVVGRANAQAAGRRLFAAFNNQRLNTSIIYGILDEVVSIIFNDVRE